MGKKPKDHHRANIRALREAERKQRQKRAMAQAVKPAVRVIPPRYRSVPSKLKEELTRPSTAPAGGRRPFLKAGSKKAAGAPPRSTRYDLLANVPPSTCSDWLPAWCRTDHTNRVKVLCREYLGLPLPVHAQLCRPKMQSKKTKRTLQTFRFVLS